MKTSISVACAFFVASASMAAEPLREASGDPIGYHTVDEAMTALRMRPDVEITENGGWTIVADRINHVIWSFTPKDHPAHPAVVRRTIVQKGDDLNVQMGVLCQAAKAPCDALVREFQALNARMRDSMQRSTTQQN